MATTFLKRQKEMKRQEKAREKAERRAQKKLEPRTGNEISYEPIEGFEDQPLRVDADLDILEAQTPKAQN